MIAGIIGKFCYLLLEMSSMLFSVVWGGNDADGSQSNRQSILLLLEWYYRTHMARLDTTGIICAFGSGMVGIWCIWPYGSLSVNERICKSVIRSQWKRNLSIVNWLSDTSLKFTKRNKFSSVFNPSPPKRFRVCEFCVHKASLIARNS